MLTLKKQTTQKLLALTALTALALVLDIDQANAQSLLTSTTNLSTNAATLPKIITGLAMPIGIFMMIMGGLGLIKLGKEPNPENVRNVIFKFAAGAFCLTLNWVVPFITNTLGLNAAGPVNSAASQMAANAFQ